MKNPTDSFKTRSSLNVGGQEYHYFDLNKLEKDFPGKVARLPMALRILLENLLRLDDGSKSYRNGVEAIVHWSAKDPAAQEISFMPARVVLQDFTGVPAIVDLAVMRDACATMGGDPAKINPQLPAELVIDHSVQVDFFGRQNAFQQNVEREYERNQERYAFLRWGQKAFENFSVVPPGTGIVHQVNLEYLGKVVFTNNDSPTLAYPDTLVGTDSHTTMINGLGILGWGVGGIEAEAAMLGQPISLLIPEVVGFKIEGKLREGATATDLVLTVTQMLRQHGVVGKFVEFYGSGLKSMSVADRATISNMSPEYGATCGLFHVDEETLNYLKFTGRSDRQVELVKAYMQAQSMFAVEGDMDYSSELKLNLADVEPSLAGPRRPQDRFALKDSKKAYTKAQQERLKLTSRQQATVETEVTLDTNGGETFSLADGAVTIAAITSCTNTSNPSVMLAAGLLAKKAVERGLNRKTWVKSSLAPGSKVVTDYLQEAGLTPYLEKLGFHLVGYGCTTCIGNSGPLPEAITEAIQANDLTVCAVLSGNRNFEGRIHPHVRFSYLASPPLVVAYALAGTMDMDLYNEPLGKTEDGEEIFLKDVWPTPEELSATLKSAVKTEMFAKQYAKVFDGDDTWKALPIPEGDRYEWNDASTYIKAPTFFDNMPKEPPPLQPIDNMRLLALLGDSVTTDHISPAGAIPKESPAGSYLLNKGVAQKDFNSFGSRRGNHEVMTRGTFGNIRLRNQLAPGTEGGFTKHPAEKAPISIYDAAIRYAKEDVPLMVIAGKEYGSGSSRDWAAKGTRLLGVKAVLAESFERIHRSNLIGMGVLPLEFLDGESVQTLKLTGEESFALVDLDDKLQPGAQLTLRITKDGSSRDIQVQTRIDTPGELTYYRHGGILHYVLRKLSKAD